MQITNCPWGSGLVALYVGLLLIRPFAATCQVYQELYVFPVALYGQGAVPQSPLIQANDGNFYGTTYNGGASYNPTNNPDGYGTVFRMTPAGVVTILASFEGTNGAYPIGALVQASDGNLYGTTEEVSNGDGSLFRITTNGVLTMLYVFTGGDGATPNGSLVQGPDGALYGTCQQGGADGGTVFRIPLAWLTENTGNGLFAITNFHVFDPHQWSTPSGGLILGSDGKFYGVVFNGPASAPYGGVYSITSNGVFTVLASFDTNYARFPYDRLLQGSDGSLYGVSEGGGNGTVFAVRPSGILDQFPFPYWDGSERPNGGLIQANDGALYGTCQEGGTTGAGLIFKMTPDGVITAYISFTANDGPCAGSDPAAGLIQGSDGNLYGTCSLGGGGAGNVFRVVMPGPLLSFSQTGPNLVLSWRTNYVGYTLQSSLDLTNWNNCAKAPCISAEQYLVTNALSARAGFFRLVKPGLTTEDQFLVATNNGAITITRYFGYGGLVVIPSVIDGLPVTAIGESAFSLPLSPSLTGITIPNSVTSIGDNAFNGCTCATSVTIPNSVTNIGAWAFEDCGLTALTIPDSVASIGEGAFFSCGSLTNVAIPKNVTNIGDAAFAACAQLAAITVDPANAFYSSSDGVLFDKHQTTLLQFPCRKGRSYAIPASVINIEDDAFYYCTNLTSVTIPNGTSNIGDSAFYECTSLTNAVIPNSVTSVGNDAYNSCASLSNLTLGASIASIGDDAFCSCPLRSVIIPGSVTRIGEYAFYRCMAWPEPISKATLRWWIAPSSPTNIT